MNKPDTVEIWLGDQVILRVDSSFAPMVGDSINIKKATYCVVSRSFAVDHADDVFERQVRCNVTVALAEGK